MIYAIPHSRDCVANHFMKAKQFAFLNQDNTFINNAINPGAGGSSSCSDKKAAMTLIKEMKADAVIVRNIGERSLGKLLSAGIRVFQVTQQTPVSMAIKSPMVELTEVASGRPSKNHINKGGCSGHSGGCGGHHEDGHSCGCGGETNVQPVHQHQHIRSGKGHGHGKGKSRHNVMRSISSISTLNNQ